MKVEFAQKTETLGDMKDGDIAICMPNDFDDVLDLYNNVIVQRYGNDLVAIGRSSLTLKNLKFAHYFTYARTAIPCPCKILKAGDKITIE